MPRPSHAERKVKTCPSIFIVKFSELYALAHFFFFSTDNLYSRLKMKIKSVPDLRHASQF